MYSRTILIEEPQRTENRKLLRSYVDERLQWDGSDNARATSASTALLDRLSAQTAAAMEKNPRAVVVDRPGDGWIIVPQDAMVDVRNGFVDSKP